MERKPRVLVVDDETVVRSSLDRVLSEGGYAVDTVPDGPRAIERSGHEPFDIAFVDLKMPGMPGMEVARNLRRTHPTMQVVIITGYGTADAATEAATLGVHDFVSKPLTPETITSVAGQAWDRRRRILEQLQHAEAEVAARPEPVAEKPGSLWKATAQMIGGSLLGLVYVVFLPVVGFAVLGWAAGKKIYGWVKA